MAEAVQSLRFPRAGTLLLAAYFVTAFIADLLIPYGYGEWAIYILGMLLAMRIATRRALFFSAGATSAFLLTGIFYGPPGGNFRAAVVARSMAFILTWGMVWLALRWRRSDEVVRRVNRALRTISECNQVMVRARDEAALLQSVCRILIELGGYGLAWVGFAEQDEAKTIRPAAQAGKGGEFLSAAQLTWSEQCQTGAAQAIRTGEICIIRHTVDGSGRGELSADPLKCGYPACITLPLVNDSQPFGALSLCSATPNSFDAEEVKLLNELAHDLAYGVQALRDRAERQRTEEELRKSEAQYRTVVENIPQKIVLKSRDFRWVSVNENFARDLGLSPTDIVGKVDYDLFPKALADKYRADDQRVMETGSTDEFDEEYLEGNERRFVHTIKTPVKDKDGGIIGVLVMFWDVTERIRAEQELRRANAYNRGLIEASLDPLVTISADGKITDVNAATEMVTGRRRGELIGTDFSDYFTDPEKARRGYQQVFREGSVQDYELEIRHRDGHTTPVFYNASVYRNDQGAIEGVFAAARDLTERKRAEEALRRSAASLAQAQATAKMGSWEEELATRKAVWSAEMFHLTGFDASAEPPDYADFLEMVHPEDRPALPKTDAQVAETGQVARIEFRSNPARGPVRVFLGSLEPMRDAQGRVDRLSGVLQDITERKRAEEELRLGRERLALAFRAGRSGSFEYEPPTNRNLWSPEIEEIYGVEPGGFGGTYEAWEQLVHPEDLEAAKKAVQESFQTGELKGEWRVRRRRDGETRWLEARGKVFFDDGGKPLRMIGINTDITERKRAEFEIQALNESLERRVLERTAELEAANKELEAFTYSVSHDLRAPLRHVDGFARLLTEEFGPRLPEDAQHYLQRIQSGTRQMGQLVDDLLNLSRIGRREPAMQITGLGSLVDEVVADLKTENPGRKIDWKISPLPFVECDPALLKQVLANLISNAVKFTRPRQTAEIEIGVRRHNGCEAVFVRDNGVGFSMKYADKLFGVFQRLHRAEDFEGTGVGLATVHRIIHKHHGEVWAEGELDRGATFYFTLGEAPPTQSQLKGEAA